MTITESKPFVSKKDFNEWINQRDLIIAKVISRLAVLTETKIYLFWGKVTDSVSDSNY